MRRLVFVTQQIDPDHPNLAAATAMVRALAAQVDEVVVIALRAVPGVLPANCTVRVIEGGTQAARGLSYLRILVTSLRPRPMGLVAHMSPIYAVLAAPVLRPLGVPVVLWFTHWRRSRLLEVAERVSSRVVTVARPSFPIPSSRKVVAIGHGIDLTEFPCGDRRTAGPSLRALALGRTSPAKGLETVARGIAAARERGVDVELTICGPSETAEEQAHREQLESLAGGAVHVQPPVARTHLPELFAATDVLVNNAAEGSLDKVVFEACASCVPVLASNSGFADLLPAEARFDRADPEQIAGGLEWLAGLGPEGRHALGGALRRRVAEHHSTETWARRVVEVVSTS